MSEPQDPTGSRTNGDAPGPLDDHDAALDASIRIKFSMGQRLDAEERDYLARLPGEKEQHY